MTRKPWRPQGTASSTSTQLQEKKSLRTTCRVHKPSIVKLLSLPEKRLGQPNRETATAQHCRPAYVGGRRKTAWLRGAAGVTSAQAPTPLLSFPSLPRPVSEGVYIRYGMATVLPYVGPVKRLSLYIVSQAINGAGAGLRNGFSTMGRRDFASLPTLGTCGALARFRGQGQVPGDQGTGHERVRTLKEPARPDALRPTGLHQIVALRAALFPAECVYECERLAELLCPDQESAAINLPRAVCSAHVCSPMWKGVCRFQFSNWLESSWRRGRIYALRAAGSIP
jgi:hypothetical protein